MKSILQERAEQAAIAFVGGVRKPVVIEFAGSPKAGKTTTLAALQGFLKRCGFRVEVVVERASVCPIRDKKHANFNVWTACTTLSQVLEKTQDPPRVDDPHVLILDRGLFDSICWLSMMEHLARIRRSDREVIESFLLAEDWRKRISGVFLMLASPEDSMEREKGYPPVEGAKGSIMNEDVLKQFRETATESVRRLANAFRVFEVDTSKGDMRNDRQKSAEYVVETTIQLIEEQIQEDILSSSKDRIAGAFQGKTWLDAVGAQTLVEVFLKEGEFKARKDVEASTDRVQAIPVVVVRNKSGDILRLRRREKTEDNPLHKRMVIWAGGHVRKEDGSNGSCLLNAAVRELREELRLNVETKALRLVGAAYLDVGGSTSKHAAVVYEWKAETDDVAVALSASEFFERRGTSLSGSFVKAEDLAKEVAEGKAAAGEQFSEPWSEEIVRGLLADKGKFNERLF